MKNSYLFSTLELKTKIFATILCFILTYGLLLSHVTFESYVTIGTLYVRKVTFFNLLQLVKTENKACKET